MTRGGRDKGRETPERRCIATRDLLPKAELLRFVLSPDGVVTPDIKGNLPGRGIYVRPDRKSLDIAIAKKLFARAAKAPATIPDNLTDLIEAGFARSLTNLISLARRDGSAICGYEKTKALLTNTDSVVLLQASDGSPRQKSKIRAPEGKNKAFSCLTAAELGLAFGREGVIHAAVAAGGLSRRIQAEAIRLSGYRNITSSSQGTQSGLRSGVKGK